MRKAILVTPVRVATVPAMAARMIKARMVPPELEAVVAVPLRVFLLDIWAVMVEVERLFAVTDFTYPDFSITLYLYECTRKSDFALKEHEGYAFFAPADLKAEEWAPADAEVLGMIKRVFGGL